MRCENRRRLNGHHHAEVPKRRLDAFAHHCLDSTWRVTIKNEPASDEIPVLDKQDASQRHQGCANVVGAVRIDRWISVAGRAETVDS